MTSPDFAPPRLLANRHVQSVMSSLPVRSTSVRARAAALLAAAREHLLDCGQGVRLQGFLSAQRGHSRGLVVLHHGWEGSVDSLYVLSAGQYLYERGFDVFRLNLRDHGDTHHLNPELFHSCRLPEVVGAVSAIAALRPGTPLSLAGFSLGGNFALRVGARASEAGLSLHRIVAICPVLDPERTLAALECGFVLYRHHFVRKWRRSLQKKRAAWPALYAFDDLLGVDSLTTMTDVLVRRHTEYPDLATYLRGYAITGGVLETLRVPSRIIAALDDPIIPAEDLSRLARVPALTVTAVPRGGHCGFLDSLRGPSYVDREIHAELTRG